MDRLDGWKAIGAYLRRDERTARRWAEGGLPVHRVPGPGRGSVYALADEIDAWLETGRLQYELDQPEPAVVDQAAPVAVRTASAPWWRRRWPAPALTALAVAVAGFGAITVYQVREDTPTNAPMFADPATKAIFLQASYDWNLRTLDSLSRAVREYGDLITRDPRIPAGYVGLANSYLLLREFGSLADADAYARAEAAAQAATALSPQSPEAHRALAFIAFWWRQDRATARREFHRALSLAPNDPLSHHWMANALLANGEPQAALHEIDRARDLDPDSTSIVADRAMILYVAGHRAEGLASLRALVRDEPQNVSLHRTLAEIALYENRPEEFLRETAATARLRSDTAGLKDVARWRALGPSSHAFREAMLRDAEEHQASWFRVASLAAVAGRHDVARIALARACNVHEPAAISAQSNLWLSLALSHQEIAEDCGQAAPLS